MTGPNRARITPPNEVKGAVPSEKKLDEFGELWGTLHVEPRQSSLVGVLLFFRTCIAIAAKAAGVMPGMRAAAPSDAG